MKTRVKNDAYPTEQGIIAKVATIMPELFEQAIYFEPCAGSGDLVRAIANHTQPTAKFETADLYCGWHTYLHFDARSPEDWKRTTQPQPFFEDTQYDIHPFASGIHPSVSETQRSLTQQPLGPYDVIITNPPFSDAPAIATQCWNHTKRYLCLILRLSFLEQCKDRREFWQDTQDHLVMIAPINPRPRFRSDTSGSDNMTCAVFVWDKMRSWKEKGVRSPYQMISDWRG